MMRTHRQVSCRRVTGLRRQKLHPTVTDGPKHILAATDLLAARHCERSRLLVVEGHALPATMAREHRGDLDMAVAGFHRKVHRPSRGYPTDLEIRFLHQCFALGIDESHQDFAGPLMIISITTHSFL